MPDQLPDTRIPDTQEFFENLSQTNALNAKRTYDEFQDISLTAARRGQSHFDDLNGLFKHALQSALLSQDMLAKATIKSMQNGNTLSDQNLNPVSQGAGETMSGAVGTAAAGQAVNAEAITTTLAQQFNATLTPIVATLSDLVKSVSALASTLVTAAGGASTPSQTQPKPSA